MRTATKTAGKTADQAVAAELRLVVTRLARRMRQQADTPITPSMLSALSSVEARGPITLRELADAERIQPPTMTVIASRLEETGLVRRDADPSDRRIARVSITPEGQRLLDQHRTRKEAYLARKLRNLSSGDIQTIKHAVVLLERILEEE